jgi:hypothetical protein
VFFSKIYHEGTKTIGRFFVRGLSLPPQPADKTVTDDATQH